MNILLLQNTFNQTCGVTRSILNLVDSFNKYPKYHFFLIVEENNLVNLENRHNLEKVVVYNSSKLMFFFHLLLFIKKNKIDVIHSHHRYFDLVSFVASKIFSVKTIMTVHSKVLGLRKISYNSEKIIAVSNAILSHLVKEFKINKNKITVIPNSIDIEKVKITTGKEILLKELNIEEGKKIIGYLGRIDIKEKGIDILLKAINKVDRDIILLLIGKGSNEEYVKNFIKNCRHRIILLKETTKVYDYYNVMNIFVLPSRIDPFPTVLMEAEFQNYQ